MLNAEHVERNRGVRGFDYAVVTNDTVLSSAQNHLSRNQHERLARFVSQCEPVHFRAVAHLTPVNRVRAPVRAKLGDGDLARSQPFVESYEVGASGRFIGEYWKHGEVVVGERGT